MCILALVVMFLPRRLYFAGMYSFRVVLLGLLLLFLAYQKGKIKIHPFMKNPFLWLYFIVLTIVYIKYSAITSFVGFLLDTILLLFLVFNLIDSEMDYKAFVKIFTWGLLIYSLMGVVEVLTGFNIWNIVGNQSISHVRYGLHRFVGCMTTSLNNGVFMILCMPVLMNEIVKSKTKKEYWFNVIVYGLVCMNTILTLTRSVMLGMIVLNFWWWLKCGALKWIRKYFVIIVFALILLVCVFQIPAIANATESFVKMFLALIDSDVAKEIAVDFGSNARGTGERVQLYYWVWDAVQGDVLLGKGPYKPFDYLWFDSLNIPRIKQSIENQYLACLFRYGMLGLITMLMFFGSCLGYIVHWGKVFKRANKGLTFGFLTFSAILVYFAMLLLVGMADDIKMFFLLLGLYFANVVSDEVKKTNYKEV